MIKKFEQYDNEKEPVIDKKRTLEYARKLEVVEEVDIRRIMDGQNLLITIYREINQKLTNKYVSFVGSFLGGQNQIEYRFLIKRVEIILYKETGYAVFFYTGDDDMFFRGNCFNVNVQIPVKIWAVREVSENDPYGEENWEGN